MRPDHLTRIAPRSRLIRVLDRLYHGPDPAELQAWQGTLQRLHLRYNLDNLEGRLEFMADLVDARTGGLEPAEVSALGVLADVLCRRGSQGSPFADFAGECLAGAIARAQAGTPPCRAHFPCALAGTLVALSLSGFLATACSPQADSALPAVGTAHPSAAVVKPQADPEPDRLTPQTIAPALHTAPSLQPAVTYTVQKGDSVRSIARRFGCNYRTLVHRNGITYDRRRDWFVLYPGQVLIVPGTPAPAHSCAAPPAQAAGSAFVLRHLAQEEAHRCHLIRRGESLWVIARRYGVTVQEIVALNGISDPARIEFGDLLKIPGSPGSETVEGKPFTAMTRAEKVAFLRDRTIAAGHPYLEALVEASEEFQVDPRLYASLIWEESWFDADARSGDNCRRLAQLDPRFHRVSDDIRANFERSLRYLRHEFTYYRRQGFDPRSATLCALAAYNGGNTRIRRFIREGLWDGRDIATIPLYETRNHLRKIARRCRDNYHALL